jgi:MFS transporter, ACS family, tartrate transporter
MPSTSAPLSKIETETMRRITWRLIPFFMLCYFISYVDRVNAGFAALQMNKDLGLTQAAFGAGGALFYIAYIVFEVPSNLAMQKVGARIWIGRIMVSWGAVGILSAFAVGPITFYLSRFLLGAAEAGFFPGVILYLTYWFPTAYRARIVAVFMVAIPLSSFLGSPISGSLLAMDGLLGLRGWQWLFIIEAIPAVVLGLISFFGLPNKPADAEWLEPEARAWLDERLQSERSMAKKVGHMSLWQILTNKYVLILGLIYAGSSATSNALSLWQPQIVKSFGMSNFETGLLNAIPFGIASVAMIFWGRYSDRSNAHAQNTAIPLALCAMALLATMLTSSLPVTLAILSVVLIGNYSIKGPFWALATGTLSPATAAAGIAGINTLSHIGTSGAVWLLGVIKEATGSFPIALIPLAVLQIAGIIAVLWINKSERHPVAATSPAH